MLTNLVQHCILVLCKAKHSLLNLFNTRRNGSVVKAQMWNIVVMAIHLVLGPKSQMLEIVDTAIQVGRARGPGHSGQTIYKLCNANMCDIRKCFSLVYSGCATIFCMKMLASSFKRQTSNFKPFFLNFYYFRDGFYQKLDLKHLLPKYHVMNENFYH
jgi:hypothetical protein